MEYYFNIKKIIFFLLSVIKLQIFSRDISKITDGIYFERNDSEFFISNFILIRKRIKRIKL